MSSRSLSHCWYVWFPISGIILEIFFALFLFYLCLYGNVVTKTGLHIPGEVGHGTCRMGAWVLCFCSWSCRQWILVRTLFAILQPFSVCFCHLMSLVMVLDHVVLLLLLVVGLPLCSFVVCCCDQCALLHICQHWSSSAICSPSQLACLLRSSCYSRTLSRCLELWQSFVSLVNLDILLTVPLSRSVIYMRKNSVPITLNCGTPDVTDVQLLKVWLIQTLWHHQANQFQFYWATLPWMPCVMTFKRSYDLYKKHVLYKKLPI